MAFLSLLSLATACHPGTPPSAHTPGTPEPPPATALAPEPALILVEHSNAGAGWRASYQLPVPVRELRFGRNLEPGRASHWRLVTPDLRWAREGAKDLIVSEGGKPFREVIVEIEAYYLHPEKDYQCFIRYSDGGILVYTGQFDLEQSDDAHRSTRLTFVPRANERVVLEGDVTPGKKTWLSTGEGTYVYFGTTQTTPEEGFVAVVDTGMPGWLRASVSSLMPALARFYGERIGIPLPFRPSLYLSYGDDPSPGLRSIGGGVLQHSLQLDIRLGTEISRGPHAAVLEAVSFVVAHEAAHFYNATLFHRGNHDSDWLPEGGADAFAFEALAATGNLAPARRNQLESEAFSKCLVGTSLGPLDLASVPGRFKLYYWCGHLISHIARAAASRSQPKRDLFAFWAELWRNAPDGLYTEDQYLQLLGSLPDGSRATRLVRRLLAGSAEDVVPALLDLDRGLSRAPEDAALPASYREFSGLVALTLILRRATGHDIIPLPAPDGWRVEDPALGGNQRWVELEGINLRGRGAEAYDAAVASCAAHGTVTATRRSGAARDAPLEHQTLSCPTPFPRRPAYIDVTLAE